MHKKILLFIFFICVSWASYAQNVFQKTYGGSGDDYGFDVIPVFDGGYVLCGTTLSYGNAEEVQLTKIDATGNVIWSKTYGTVGGDAGNIVLQSADSGLVVCGLSNSGSAGGFDAMLMKTDASGNLLWTKLYGSSGFETTGFMQPVSDGGFILAGNTSAFGAGADALIIRTDANGDTLWTKIFQTPIADVAASVTTDLNGNFYACGRSGDSPSQTASIFLTKLDDNGDSLWTKYYNDTAWNEFDDVKITSQNELIFCGASTSSGNDFDALIAKADTNGNIIWNRSLTGYALDALYNVIEKSPGLYASIGFANSFGFGHPEGSDSSNSVLVNFNDAGDTLSIVTYGEGLQDEAFRIHLTADSGLVSMSQSKSFGPDTLDYLIIKSDINGLVGCNEIVVHPVLDSVLLIQQNIQPACFSSGFTVSNVTFIENTVTVVERDACIINRVSEEISDEISIYPNPANNRFEIKTQKSAWLSLSDIAGRPILHTYISDGVNSFDTSSMPSGLYILQVEQASKKSTHKIIVQH